MTKKLAIFVEGQTEQIFTKKLVTEIAGRKNVIFEEKKYYGNDTGNVLLRRCQDEGKAALLVLINDCARDEHVKTIILEERELLEQRGYTQIIGLRDLHPIEKVNFSRLEQSLNSGLPEDGIPISFVIAVMEVEAWFLQEWKHYENIDATLTMQNITNNNDFDPINHNAEDVLKPSDKLHQIYQIAKKGYSKKRATVEKTVDALDYENLYINICNKLPQLKQFIDHIDNFV